MNLAFACEPFSDALLAEMLPHLREHWKEVAHFADIPLEVDAAVYHAAEARGALRIYTVRATERMAYAQRDGGQFRTEPNELLGYAVYFVRANPHYASSVQAVQDVIYIDPHCRGGAGARFIAWCDVVLQQEGVQAVYHHVKTAHNWGKLLARMGYEAVDVIYAKRLDLKVES